MPDINKFRTISGETFKEKVVNLFQTITNGVLKDFTEGESGKLLEDVLSQSVIKNLANRYKGQLNKHHDQKIMQTKTLLTQATPVVSLPKLAGDEDMGDTEGKKIITPEGAKKSVPEVKEVKVAKKSNDYFKSVLLLARERAEAENIGIDIRAAAMDERTLTKKEAADLDKLYE